MKIAVLIGSLRKNSFNLGLIKTMQERYAGRFQLEILNIEKLPYYNEDEENNPPMEVVEFKNKIAEVDGVLISTPEYNWSIPGILKNSLDWLSRGERVMINKPVMIIGVSTGMLGTIRAQTHLRQILASPGLNCRVLAPAGNEVLIGFANQKFNHSGKLIDEQTLTFLDEVAEKFIMFTSDHL